MEHLWFVPFILICYLLLPYLLFLESTLNEELNINKLKLQLWLLFILQIIGFTFEGYGVVPNRITCFICGVFLGTIKNKKSCFRKISILICLTSICLNIIRLCGSYILLIENNLIFALFVRCAHGFLGVALFLIFYHLFKNTEDNAILRLSDRYSYCIYLVHQIFIIGPLSLMGISSNIFMNVIIILSLILLYGILLERMTIKINEFINKFQSFMK